VGIALEALAGWLIGCSGVLTPSSGGIQVLGALIGVLIVLPILILSEALKIKE